MLNLGSGLCFIFLTTIYLVESGDCVGPYPSCINRGSNSFLTTVTHLGIRCIHLVVLKINKNLVGPALQVKYQNKKTF